MREDVNIKALKALGVHYEVTFIGRHCYKAELPDCPIIIITSDTQEEAAKLMVEALKEQGV